MPPRNGAASPDWSRLTNLILPLVFVGAILVFIVPLPPALLDLLLSANLTAAVLILLTVLSIRTPQEFSAFPTLLVTTTLTRLVLNVAVTRRILTHGGTDGLDAAGHVIRAFGEFVAGDQVVVGAIVFAILVIIQFVVITKGATRISEVAARFMLDGLPGRQMAIDADLHAGLIDHHDAGRRRDALYRQADFFGAMDGAGKFVRGDAVAGVLITLVNILAGLYLGIVQHGMSAAEAVDVFTKLTIGDGLVSQVPAFLISLAAGLIVTRSSSESDLGREVTSQLFGRAEVLAVAAGFLVLLSFSGLPQIPLWTLAAALGCGAYLRWNRDAESETSEPNATPAEHPPRAEPVPSRPASRGSAALAAAIAGVELPPGGAAALLPSGGAPPERVEDLLQVDPLELETGYRLIGLSDPARGDLLERVRGVRQRVARELGLIVPQVRIRDDLALNPNEYRFKIRGAAVARGTAYAGRLLAVPPAGLVTRPDGRDGVDPNTGQPAVWIHADGREVAELAGCRVLDAAAVVADHFGEVIADHADELLTHEQVRQLLDRTRQAAPSLVDEVVPGLLRVGEVQRLLQNLVRERVGIRDLESILEALAEHAGRTKDLGTLTELVRQALGRRLVQPYLSPQGRLAAATLSPALEERLAAWAAGEGDPAEVSGWIQAIAEAIAPMIEAGLPTVVITAPEVRPVVKDLTRADLPRLVVLSRKEIPRDAVVELVATADIPPPDANETTIEASRATV